MSLPQKILNSEVGRRRRYVRTGSMEGVFSGKEAYRQHFDPKGFFNVYMLCGSMNSSDCDPIYAFLQEMLHKTFLVDGIQGDTLIDIGSGPSIYQLLSACESFKEIIATDLLEQNRAELRKWLKKDPEALDWTPMVKYTCQLEGNREKWKEKEEKLRRTIKQVLPCDVTLANPLDPLVLQPVDAVISTFCLESACDDLPTYCSAMKNVGSLVKPGGHLIFAAIMEENYYMVGSHKFGCLYLMPEMVRDAVKGAGFEILWSQGFGLTSLPSNCDAKGTFFLVAKKPSESQ
ncbi:nicotinamide N-methyltransferase-like [Anolis sagrei]|uniref:nicotinamide N-methyltransferase-like n=1 Tax=Anolis sagrei TaxID=38937 RepID=UPI003522B57C